MGEFEDGFYSYIRNEAKEYVCVECGTNNLKATTRKYINPFVAEVTLKCVYCVGERVVTMRMPD
ncbi:hypothetical protein NZ043_27350 [Paenibacillus sp. FSL k6-2145]|uniref:hypothetical protein n=1 Tax=Paenibacillus sp. FSL k6-2145 TaxID=2976834 RepID=UPI0030D8CF25